jgi:hypothetical protein
MNSTITNERLYTDANGTLIVDRRKRCPATGKEIIPANGEVEVFDNEFKALEDFRNNEWTLAKKQLPNSTVLGYVRHVQRNSGWDEDTDYHVEFLTWVVPETDILDAEPDEEPFWSIDLVPPGTLEYDY